MVVKIQPWGNSLGLRIPIALAREIKVSGGSTVDIAVEDGHLVIRPVRREKYTLQGLLKDIKPSMLHGEIPTGDASGREAF